MRILIAHCRYSSGAVSGENRVVDNEIRLLREGGHEVVEWTPEVGGTKGVRLLAAGVDAVWSRHAAAEVRSLVARHRIEVVHCHNLFPALSPSALRAGASAGAAVVMTLHNYRLLCLPATFLRDDRVCEDCLGRIPWRGVRHRCYRGSATGSAALAVSHTVHRAAGSFDKVALYLAVSRFVKRKHVEAGWSADRIRVKPNFAWPVRRRTGPGERFVYVGRLSSEKGVDFLLRVWRSVPAGLVVVGDGPDRERLQGLAPPGVEFLGAVAPEEVARQLSAARALVLPSRCYEGAPAVIPEAYAAGVPVVASDAGGMTEAVAHEESGILVPPEQARPWVEAVTRLLDDGDAVRMGNRAFELWQSRFSPTSAIRDLEDAYRLALAGAA